MRILVCFSLLHIDVLFHEKPVRSIALQFLTALVSLTRAGGLYSTSFWEGGEQDRKEE